MSKVLTALFSNIDGAGSDCIFIGCDIHESVVDELNAALPTSFKARFYLGTCIIEYGEYNDVDTRVWYLQDMGHKGVHLAYDRTKHVYTQQAVNQTQ